jgi:hypothetical protein
MKGDVGWGSLMQGANAATIRTTARAITPHRLLKKLAGHVPDRRLPTSGLRQLGRENVHLLDLRRLRQKLPGLRHERGSYTAIQMSLSSRIVGERIENPEGRRPVASHVGLATAEAPRVTCCHQWLAVYSVSAGSVCEVLEGLRVRAPGAWMFGAGGRQGLSSQRAFPRSRWAGPKILQVLAIDCVVTATAQIIRATGKCLNPALRRS